MKKKGFSLIEIVVVAGTMAVVMVTVSQVLFNSFRSKNRVEKADDLEQSGNWVLEELRKNVINSLGVGLTCDTPGRLTLSSASDGEVTTLTCSEDGQIASASASRTDDLLSGGHLASNCGNFVSCDPRPQGGVGTVNFQFTLTAPGGSDIGVSRVFHSRVVVRN